MEDLELRQEVRDRYAQAATGVLNSTEAPGESCCGGPAADGCADGRFGSTLYDIAERADLPVAAVEASLGCGNPLGAAELREGETVLDLGSGGGIDVLLSAKRVGPAGKAYGLDMTDEMLELARRNATEAGATNVEFLKGEMEAIPLPDAAVDVVISNCVINLSTDKAKVLAEAHRVLKPGGRVQVSDVVAEDHLTPDQRAERGEWVGCIAGALSIGEYRDGLTAAGFVDVDVRPTHEVADGMHSAVVTAVKPALPTVSAGARDALAPPVETAVLARICLIGTALAVRALHRVPAALCPRAPRPLRAPNRLRAPRRPNTPHRSCTSWRLRRPQVDDVNQAG